MSAAGHQRRIRGVRGRSALPAIAAVTSQGRGGWKRASPGHALLHNLTPAEASQRHGTADERLRERAWLILLQRIEPFFSQTFRPRTANDEVKECFRDVGMT